MAFIEDHPIPDQECWFRILTNTDHVTSSGTLHYQALKGTQFSQSHGKPWAHELSGLVVSLMGGIPDIERRGESRIASIHNNLTAQGKKIPSKIHFIGVASAGATELRAIPSGLPQTDVVYTPINDPAHADVVTYQTTDATLDPVRNWLLTVLRVTPSTNLALLVSSCGS
jgi:hypothetical protein